MHTPKKSFFETYQTFISIIIVGVLIAAAIIVAKAMPSKGAADQAGTPETGALTQDQVRDQLVKVVKDNKGVNVKQFEACLDAKEKEPFINDAVALAQKSGVQGTPTFFVLKRTYSDTGEVTSDKQIEIIGARDHDTFVKAIVDGKSPSDQPQSPAGDKIVLSQYDHYLGPKNAAVTIVEYSDIECPFCKREKPIIDQILKEHPEYAFVYRHSPIVQLHPWAAYKAQASECVANIGGEDAFWKFLNVVTK